MTHAADTDARIHTIYRHDDRPEWGDAILAWEREDKRGYQFEDGTLRVFKQGWYGKLQEVDRPLAKAEAMTALAGRNRGIAVLPAASRSFDGTTFDDQLRLFEHLYGDGFAGTKWAADKRGVGVRRLKRHRDPAVAHAREVLDVAALDARVAGAQFDLAWDEVLGVLDGTDLVTKRHVAALTDLGSDARRRLVLATRRLLWGDERYEIRFEGFVGALAASLGKPPSWPLATALSALVHPDEHVCVRPSTARAQAAWMAPRLRFSNTPTAAAYVRLVALARAVRSKLADAGAAPRDLLDVVDFMWVTLRPRARVQLEALSAPAADHAREAA